MHKKSNIFKCMRKGCLTKYHTYVYVVLKECHNSTDLVPPQEKYKSAIFVLHQTTLLLAFKVSNCKYTVKKIEKTCVFIL